MPNTKKTKSTKQKNLEEMSMRLVGVIRTESAKMNTISDQMRGHRIYSDKYAELKKDRETHSNIIVKYTNTLKNVTQRLNSLQQSKNNGSEKPEQSSSMMTRIKGLFNPLTRSNTNSEEILAEEKKAIQEASNTPSTKTTLTSKSVPAPLPPTLPQATDHTRNSNSQEMSEEDIEALEALDELEELGKKFEETRNTKVETKSEKDFFSPLFGNNNANNEGDEEELEKELAELMENGKLLKELEELEEGMKIEEEETVTNKPSDSAIQLFNKKFGILTPDENSTPDPLPHQESDTEGDIEETKEDSTILPFPEDSEGGDSSPYPLPHQESDTEGDIEETKEDSLPAEEANTTQASRINVLKNSTGNPPTPNTNPSSQELSITNYTIFDHPTAATNGPFTIIPVLAAFIFSAVMAGGAFIIPLIWPSNDESGDGPSPSS